MTRCDTSQSVIRFKGDYGREAFFFKFLFTDNENTMQIKQIKSEIDLLTCDFFRQNKNSRGILWNILLATYISSGMAGDSLSILMVIPLTVV